MKQETKDNIKRWEEMKEWRYKKIERVQIEVDEINERIAQLKKGKLPNSKKPNDKPTTSENPKEVEGFERDEE